MRLAEERVSPTGDGLLDVLFLLEQLLAEAEAGKRWPSVLEILLLLALAWEEQGDRTAALTTLGRALMLAEPEIHFQAPPATALVEPLTARERDVLRLVLLDGASNREIAGHLTLSANTVKKHISNLYGKLNVQSRAQAITKARTLHLL